MSSLSKPDWCGAWGPFYATLKTLTCKSETGPSGLALPQSKLPCQSWTRKSGNGIEAIRYDMDITTVPEIPEVWINMLKSESHVYHTFLSIRALLYQWIGARAAQASDNVCKHMQGGRDAQSQDWLCCILQHLYNTSIRSYSCVFYRRLGLCVCFRSAVLFMITSIRLLG